MVVHHILRAHPPSDKQPRERPAPLLTGLVLLTIWLSIGYYWVAFFLPSASLSDGDWTRLLPFVPQVPNLDGPSPYDVPKKISGADVRPSKGLPPVHASQKYWNQKVGAKGSRNAAGTYDLGDQPITVYLVAHSHLDPGWIETFEHYYQSKVKKILMNVVEELSVGELMLLDKKFTWCETSFLKRFWEDRSVKQITKSRLASLIWEGKFEIVGGGWVQHDESLTNFKAQLLNMEAGLKWLHSTFPGLKQEDRVVDTLWQIDPFGASDLTPLLLADDFKFALLNRVGDEIKDQLRAEGVSDFLWTSPMKPEGGILAHVTNIHYSTEQQEYLRECANSSEWRNPHMREQILNNLRDWVIGPNLAQSKHRHLMLLVGNDFSFMPDSLDFKILDMLHVLLNKYASEHFNLRISAKYATASEYFKAVEAEVRA